MISLSHARRVIQKLMDDGELYFDGDGAYRKFYLDRTVVSKTTDDECVRDDQRTSVEKR